MGCMQVNQPCRSGQLSDHLNYLQRLYVHVQPLKASFVHAQNIATVWNHCHPWQFWLNSLFILRDYKKNDLMRLPCLPVLCIFKKADNNTDHNDAERECGNNR